MLSNLLQKYKTYGFKTFLRFSWLEFIKRFYWYPIRHSYSQNQEDLIIDKLLGHPFEGFYVDVGAYDPDRFSNTKRFYEKGWRGINIEPDFYSFQKFLETRKADINLNIGIAEHSDTLTYFKMEPQTLSTFNSGEAVEYQKQGYVLVEEKKVGVETLADVLDKYSMGRPIDFLSVDTEGFDMQVLRSNDWSRFKPKVICVESVHHSKNLNPLDNGKSSEQEIYLIGKGYKKVYDNGLNSIYTKAAESDHYRKQAKYFDEASTKDVRHIEDEASKKEVETFLKFLKVTPKTHPRILEVGAGTGRFAIHLLNKGFQITATEISEESLKEIERQALEIGKRDNLLTILDPLEEEIFSNEFDLVFCVNLLHHVENIDNVFANMKKASKNRVAIIEPNPLNPLFYIDFYRKGNWRIEKGILNCSRSELLNLYKENQLKDVRLKRYIMVPNSLQRIIPGLNILNKVLMVTPVVNEFYMFHIIYGQK